MHYAFLSATLIALSSTYGSIAIAQETAPRPAKVFVVQETQDVLQRKYPATVLPSTEAEVSFRVSGQVVELPISAAQDVVEGDLIAKLDTRDFETQVALLQSQVDQANAELLALRSGARTEEIAALEAAVASAQAQVDVARQAQERAQELVNRGVAAVATLETADGDLRVAEANLEAQEENLRIGQVGARPEDIAAAEAALRGLEAQLQQAEDQLTDASLIVPFDGVISRRNIDNFTNIQAGQSIVLLQSLRPVHLAFDIPGTDVSTFSRYGLPNIVTTAFFDAFPSNEFPTEIVEFSLDADSATQTYRGRVSVEIPEGELGILPGMVADVVVSVERGIGTQLLVPLSSVAADASAAPFIWKLGADNAATSSQVELGETQGDMVEILSGVDAGDTIVSAGVSRITEGQVVRPITQVGE
ncbi:MAG: efflux RND transporter periplasmic adaptor subunit [Pseudomonadota bacterium]